MKPTAAPTESLPRPRGEVFVWLTGAGLATGMLLVLGLLGLILVKGLAGFWPHPVVEIELSPDSPFALNGATTFAGILTREQPKAVGEGEEWQLYLGNKDTYRLPFRYVDADAILSHRHPADLVVAERIAHGDALFYPVTLRTEDGESIEAAHPAFFPTLRASLATIRERGERIRLLERTEIGKISAAMEIHHRNLRTGELSPAEADSRRQQLDNLQRRYEVLAHEARLLRAQQHTGELTYRLPTGEVHTQPLGAFLRFHQPNAMGFWAKLSFFFAEIGRFLTTEPREANTEGGIFPAIFGTLIMTILMSLVVTPFGVLAAIYLQEYARQGPLVRTVRIAVNNLAGVPSIVFGVFGLGFFVYVLGGSIDALFFPNKLPTATFGTGGVFWASLTLALLTVPVVIVATEEALLAVPRGVREASLALGASKWQTIHRVVLPLSTPGILTGLILAMARGAGEVAPLMLVGVVKHAPTLPIDGIFPYAHLERKFMHLGFHVYDLSFQSPDSEAARPLVFATTLVLIALVIGLNLGALILRQHLRHRYTSATF